MKKTIKTIVLMTVLFTCMRQVAMEKHKIKTLQPIQIKDTPGTICNIDKQDKYFLIKTHDSQKRDALEIWNKKLNTKIDEINYNKLLNAIKTFYIKTQGSFPQNPPTIKITKAKYTNSNHITIKVIAFQQTGTYKILFNDSIQYTINTKELTTTYISANIRYEDWTNTATHDNYIITKKASSFEIKHNDIPQPIIINAPEDLHPSYATIYCGQHTILIYFEQAQWSDIHAGIKRKTMLYDAKTGKPILFNNQILKLDMLIPNWNKKTLCKTLFGKNDDFILFACIDTTSEKESYYQIILLDLKRHVVAGQYILPINFGTYNQLDNFNHNHTGIHLCENEQKIIAASNTNQKVYIFKNPLKNIDIDEPERRKYVQDQEDTIAMDEKPFEIIINGFNGIRIPAHRLFLL